MKIMYFVFKSLSPADYDDINKSRNTENYRDTLKTDPAIKTWGSS